MNCTVSLIKEQNVAADLRILRAWEADNRNMPELDSLLRQFVKKYGSDSLIREVAANLGRGSVRLRAIYNYFYENPEETYPSFVKKFKSKAHLAQSMYAYINRARRIAYELTYAGAGTIVDRLTVAQLSFLAKIVINKKVPVDRVVRMLLGLKMRDFYRTQTWRRKFISGILCDAKTIKMMNEKEQNLYEKFRSAMANAFIRNRVGGVPYGEIFRATWNFIKGRESDALKHIYAYADKYVIKTIPYTVLLCLKPEYLSRQADCIKDIFENMDYISTSTRRNAEDVAKMLLSIKEESVLRKLMQFTAKSLEHIAKYYNAYAVPETKLSNLCDDIALKCKCTAEIEEFVANLPRAARKRNLRLSAKHFEGIFNKQGKRTKYSAKDIANAAKLIREVGDSFGIGTPEKSAFALVEHELKNYKSPSETIESTPAPEEKQEERFKINKIIKFFKR